MRPKFNKKLISLLSLTLVSFLACSVSVTAAAFLSFEKHHQQINIDISYGKYFGSNNTNSLADGTSNNPYVISNSNHLRNLSDLVNIGSFNKDTYFELKEFEYDYATSNIPLTPIGTEQYPFKSHFYGASSGSHGEIVPILSNLVIEGNNLSDVGMFGVIGPTAVVHDFILSKPTLNVSGKEPFDPDKIDKNPLRDITNTFNGTDYIFSKSNVQSQINLTNSSPVNDKNGDTVGMKGFTLSKGNLPTTYPLSENQTSPLTYYVDYTHNEIISHTGNIETGDITFTVANNVTNPDTSKKPKTGTYIIVEIGVQGIVNTSNGPRLANMTLERYKLYFDYTKQYIVADQNELNTYKKLINPLVTSSKQDANNMLLEDNSKGIYVGVLCGTLYGDGKRIGVSGATLNIQRPFISNSILIGKALDDDEKKNMTKEEFATPAVLLDKTQLTYQYTPTELVNYNGIKNTDLGKGNRMVMDIYGPGAISEQSQNTIRVYGTRRPSNSAGDENTVLADEGVILSNNSVYTGIQDKVNENDPNVSDGVYITEDHRANLNSSDYMKSSLPSITFKDVMFNTLTDWVGVTLRSSGYKNACISNSIMLWVSGADGKAGINRWISSGIDFYLDVEVDYAIYTDDYQEVIDGSKSVSNIELTLEATRKLIEPVKIKPIFSSPYEFSYDEVVNTDKYQNGFDYFDIVRAQGERKNGNYHYLYGRYQDPNDEGANAKHLMQFNANEISGTVADRNDPNNVAKINKKHFKIKSETAVLAENSSVKGFFPYFLLGLTDLYPLSDPNDPNSPRIFTDFRFDIYGMKVSISDLKGNVDSSIGQIDFVDSYNELPITANGWNGSGIKVGAKTIENSKVVPNANASSANFIKVHDEASGITNYKITTSKSGKNVTINWQPVGSSLSQFSYIMPKGAVKFTNLTVNKV